jgi:Trk K+ transport system NAD-binding subunit
MPKGTILISVVRDKEAIIPNGQTQIMSGDIVVALTNEGNMPLVASYFLG